MDTTERMTVAQAVVARVAQDGLGERYTARAWSSPDGRVVRVYLTRRGKDVGYISIDEDGTVDLARWSGWNGATWGRVEEALAPLGY